MANEVNNTGPNNLPGGNQGPQQSSTDSSTSSTSARDTSKDALDFLKKKLRLEGDYRDILRDTVKDTNRQIRQLREISAKVESLKSSSINVREIEKQKEEILKKQKINLAEIADVQKRMDAGTKNSADEYIKAVKERNKLYEQVQIQASKSQAASSAETDLNAQLVSLTRDRARLEQESNALRGNDFEAFNAKLQEINANYEKERSIKDSISKIEADRAQISGDFSASNQALANLENEIAAREQSLNIDQASYIQRKLNGDYIEEELKKTSEKLKLEKQVVKNQGVFTNLLSAAFSKSVLLESISEKINERSRELTNSMKEREEALAKEGKKMSFGEKSAIMAQNRLKIFGAAVGGVFSGIKKMYKDSPLGKFGLIAGGILLGAKALASGVNKLGGAATNAGKSLASMGGSSAISDLTSNVTSLIKHIPFVGGLLGGVVDMFAGLLDFAVGATSKVQEMGRQIGLSKSEAVKLNGEFSDFATYTGKAYINSKLLYESQLALSEVSGLNNVLAKDSLETYAEQSKFLGIDAQTYDKLVEARQVSGKSEKQISSYIFGQTKSLEKATGIKFNFKKILAEVTSLSGILGLRFAKYPEAMIKAVVNTRALGMELNKMDGVADQFLDFQGSITKEFEAQILTGKEVNLQKARQLALDNKLDELAVELASKLGTSKDLLSMNRIEAEAYTAQLGMGVNEVADILRNQERLSAFGAKNTQELYKQVKLLKAQGREQEIIKRLGGEAAYNDVLRSSAAEDLSGFIEKIKQSFADLVADGKLADFIQSTIKWLSEPGNIMGIVNKIKDVFAKVVDVASQLIAGVMKAINWIPFMDDVFSQDMISMVSGAGDQIRGANLGSLSAAGAVSTAAADNANSMYRNSTVDPKTGLNTYTTNEGNLTVFVKVDSDGKVIEKKVNRDPGVHNDKNKNT
jgi:hypothetical protein